MDSRRVLACAAVFACHKDAAPPTSRGSAAPITAPAVAGIDAATLDGATALVELLHSMPSTVRVSSQVDNKAIVPDHLVDHDLQTAWNSRTGDLVGAWIDIDVGGAAIHELRLTVGHTGRGPKGEDYFTMNPRIRRVSVVHDGRTIGSATLDITRRDLQTIALRNAASTVRVRVDDIVPGSKPRWREACVSELEAWGALPPGVAAVATKPTVSVDAPVLDPTATAGPIADDAEYCERLLVQDRAEFAAQQEQDRKETAACDRDPTQCILGDDYRHRVPEPHCAFTGEPVAKSGPWLAVGIFSRAELCRVTIQTARGWWLVGDVGDCGSDPRSRIRTLAITSAKPHGNELQVRYLHTSPGWETTDPATVDDRIITCTIAKAVVTCSDPVDAPDPAP